MKSTLFLLFSTPQLLNFCTRTNDYESVAQMAVDFEWQQIDKGFQENPEILEAGIIAPS